MSTFLIVLFGAVVALMVVNSLASLALFFVMYRKWLRERKKQRAYANGIHLSRMSKEEIVEAMKEKP